MRFKNKKFLIPAAIIALIIITVIASKWNKVDVKAYKVSPENAVKGVTATGTVVSRQDINLSPSVTAKLRDLRVSEGDYVNKGQILAILDEEQAQGNLTSARGQLETASAQVKNLETEPRIQNIGIARAQVRELQENTESLTRELARTRIDLTDLRSEASRLTKLYEQGAVSFREAERARTQVAEAEEAVNVAQNQVQVSQAKLAQARQNLNLVLAGTKTEQIQAARGQVVSARGGIESAQGLLNNYILRAPVSGYITEELLDAGEVASPVNPVLRMVKPDSIYISTEVEENELKDVSAGKTAYIIFDAYPTRSFKSKVYSVIKSINPVTGTFEAKVYTPDTDKPILVGMTSDITIISEQVKNAIVIPTEFIQTENKKQLVYKKTGNKAEKVFVKAVIFDNNRTRIISGLKKGDIVVKGYGNKKVKDNNRVNIKEYYKS